METVGVFFIGVTTGLTIWGLKAFTSWYWLKPRIFGIHEGVVLDLLFTISMAKSDKLSYVTIFRKDGKHWIDMEPSPIMPTPDTRDIPSLHRKEVEWSTPW